MGQSAGTSWLTGILEAEGTSGLRRISIANTDLDILKEVQKFLTKRGIIHGLYERSTSGSRKKLTTVQICGDRDSLIRTLGDSFQCRKLEFLEKLGGSSTTARDIPLTPDLHWLGGIFEGEGCIGLRNDRNCYTPDIRVVNTNERIVDKIVLTLRHHKLSWYVNRQTQGQYKLTYTIRIGGLLRSRRFLTTCEQIWRSKKFQDRTGKLLEFINSRMSVIKGTPYSNQEEQVYRDLQR